MVLKARATALHRVITHDDEPAVLVAQSGEAWRRRG
jgi:hypothetical protein